MRIDSNALSSRTVQIISSSRFERAFLHRQHVHQFIRTAAQPKLFCITQCHVGILEFAVQLRKWMPTVMLHFQAGDHVFLDQFHWRDLESAS